MLPFYNVRNIRETNFNNNYTIKKQIIERKKKF
jgi:hypothetical protein